MTTMKLTINNSSYEAVPVELAKAIEAMLAPYQTKATSKAKTPKAKAEPKKSEPKQYAKPYSVNGKSVTVGNDGFIPAKVFKAVCYSLKQAGAKWDNGNKVWQFGTKKALDAWVKAQEARA